VSEPGETAINLPWVSPSTASLVALARADSSAVWPAIRTDPGMVLLLARHFPAGTEPNFPDSVFHTPDVLETALRQLHDVPWSPIDWSLPETRPVQQAALACAALAESLARRIGGLDPECCWVGGLLAPLGWFAICAVDPDAVGECLRQPVYADRLTESQRELWRLDASSIGRRLSRRWKLPLWLGAVTGYLNLPTDLAIRVGANQRLFEVVQLAMMLAATNGHDLGLTVGTEYPALLNSLRLTEQDLRQIGAEWLRSASRTTPTTQADPNPELLPDVLALAIEKRKIAAGPFAHRMEDEVDRLQEALAAQYAGEAKRLQKQKLRSLAEFAAGAGHEINNPLAVISGQSQYLLARESDTDRQNSLRTIIRQTERIHQILTELMQFAKPPQPQQQEIDARPLIQEVVAKYRPQAADLGVRLDWDDSIDPKPIHVDPTMIRTALGCLVRNALEAAPRDGWARVSIDPDDDLCQIIVEDSGPGPAAGRREHMFDPFYSGRHAGRGRGLGLPTAWRLAQENGGDVRYEPKPDSPARFVLSLPFCLNGKPELDIASESLRKSA
jgi:signal transduction histidine kinase